MQRVQGFIFSATPDDLHPVSICDSPFYLFTQFFTYGYLYVLQMSMWTSARDKVMPMVKLQEIHHTIVGSAFYQWAKQFQHSCSMEDADQLLHVDELIAPIVSVSDRDVRCTKLVSQTVVLEPGGIRYVSCLTIYFMEYTPKGSNVCVAHAGPF